MITGDVHEDSDDDVMMSSLVVVMPVKMMMLMNDVASPEVIVDDLVKSLMLQLLQEIMVTVSRRILST